MTLKQKVDNYLQQHYLEIENDRVTNKSFKWRSISNKIGEGLSSEYIRGRFRKIRALNDENILDKDTPKKKLFIDIETSFNIVYSWGIGPKIRLTPDNILEERKIICISYSWENEDKVYTLAWHKGNETKMLNEFAKVIEQADIVVGHNSDAFDIKHLRTRFIYHGIQFPHKLNTLDTLKIARTNFKFNSNKLDYLAQFLGVGKKTETGGIDLWKEVVLNNNTEALNKMISYCENDVLILKKVYEKLQEFTPTRRFRS